MSETTTCVACGDEDLSRDDAIEVTGVGDHCESCFDDEYSSCSDCGDVTHNDEITATGHGDHVCETCRDNNYFYCDCCEEYKSSEDSVWTVYEDSICSRCCDNYYSYCDHCDGYYSHDDYDHDHAEDCDCIPPTLKVAVRNGDAIIREDERATISLPSGFVSEEGIGQIAQIIRNHAPSVTANPTDERDVWDQQAAAQRAWYELSYRLEDIGTEWQAKDGNYTKRLSRFAYKTFGIKVTADVLTLVGNVGRQHSEGADYEVEFTRDLNLPAEDFAHGGSCWWTEYSASRCSLKSNGGFAMRTFGTATHDEYGYVTGPWANGFGQSYRPTGRTITLDNVVEGRSWVMPLTMVNGSLRPTFDTETPDAYVVFNGYGNLGGYAPARILASMTGLTYRKIGFECDPMYVNNGGYIVASEEIVSTTENVNLWTDQHSNLYNTERTHAHA